MKEQSFMVELIIAALTKSELQAKAAAPGRTHGSCAQTFFTWKNKHCGTDVGEAARLISQGQMDSDYHSSNDA